MAVKPDTTFTYCGKRISQLPSMITVDQWPAAAAVEPITLTKERMKKNEDPLTQEERTSYRSVVGQLMYLQTWTRPDLHTATCLAAQRTEKATVHDIAILNKAVKDMQSRPDVKIAFPRGGPTLLGRYTLLAYGDSAFANAEGEKSQCGQCLFAVPDVEAALRGDFARSIPLTWSSATVKRVVRSTLSAEA